MTSAVPSLNSDLCLLEISLSSEVGSLHIGPMKEQGPFWAHHRALLLVTVESAPAAKVRKQTQTSVG